MTAHSEDKRISWSWDEVMGERADDEGTPLSRSEPSDFVSVAEGARAIASDTHRIEMTNLARKAELAANDAAAAGDVEGRVACKEIAAYLRAEARKAVPAMSSLVDRDRGLAADA